MKLTIEIEDSELNFKKAAAKGWNNHFGEKLTYRDIKSLDHNDDILRAIPYIDIEKIEITINGEKEIK